MQDSTQSMTTLAGSRTLTTMRLMHGGPPPSSGMPMSFGIDLPRGVVNSGTQLEIRTSDDRPQLIQTTPLSRWSDGSLKWVLIDLVTNPATLLSNELSLCLRDGEADDPIRDSCPPGDVHVSVEKNALKLTRGPAATAVHFELTNGRTVEPRIHSIESEATGPVRSTLRLDGTIPASGGLRFTCRVTTYRDTGLIRLDVRLHNPNRARHPGGLWDLGDSGSVQFDSFDVVVSSGRPADQIRWQSECESTEQQLGTGALLIYQDSSGEHNWNSPVHVNAEGRVPCRFRGYELHAPGRTESGVRAQPTVVIDAAGTCLGVSVPEFREQFPSAIRAASDELRIGLFPQEWNDTFELQGGEQKTQTLWLALDESPVDLAELNWCHDAPRMSIPPAWHRTTGAFPYFSPYTDDPSDRLGELLETAIYGDDSLLSRRNTIDEFGWRHYGDVYADHEQTFFDGTKPVISHYNNQFDSIYGAILQHARTGDPRWYRLFDPLARHVIDIDIYHTEQDRAAYSGGLFWHTDHYADAGTCTHRTYSAGNAKPGQPYGGGPSDEHNYTTGLLYYYWLTGNTDARDAVVSLADWVINVDDGSQTVFGLVCSDPTGGATATGSPEYHGPGRGAGNSINALLDAWQITQKQHYLDYAETLIRRVVHPSEDIGDLDLLNAEARWSYTVCLSAIAKYLDVKHEAGQLDGTYEYAAASLAHFGRWMAGHERPYLDHPDELEFPTETWAAQELRKANVLRLAAKYCNADDQGRLLTRGDELADAAWAQLSGFPTRTVARSLAIMMTEGPRDIWLRQSQFPPFERNPTVSFGPREEFVPQKEKVKQQLRKARGLLRMLTHAATPTRWAPFVRNLRKHF